MIKTKMIFRKAALLPVFLCAQFTAAYFAQVDNAHVEFVATGAVDARAGEETVDDRASLQHAGDGLWAALEGALARHAPLGFAAPQIMAAFEEWGGKFERDYATLEERSKRLVVWLENHVMIETHNAKNLSFTLGHNDFSDLTHAEFRERMRLGEFAPALERREGHEFKFMEFNEEKEMDAVSPRLRGPGQGVATARKLPAVAEHKDWHAAGLMGPVRNQGKCGACWAFSAAGAIESAMAIDKFNAMSPADQAKLTGGTTPANGLDLTTDLGLVVTLSEQNMIDCDTKKEKGCEGGLMMSAFVEEEVKKGLCSEVDYPYRESQGTCAADACTPVPGSIVRGRVDIVPRKNNALVAALNVQPVTAAMVATGPSLQFYSSGIYNVADCGKVTKQLGDKECERMYTGQDVCLPDVNHGVLVVGYGTDAAATGDVKTFFKVKNSWGGHWGEDGYFRLARFTTDKIDPLNNWGECAILSLLNYPVMK